MSSWGGLNPALTAWRNAYLSRFPHRGTASDGARADAAHSPLSQHQSDADGTVDANDMDVNVEGSAEPTGSARERQLVEAMKLDFERDPFGRGRLWIHDGQIASRAIGNWRVRGYAGAPHDKHVHWESDQARERIADPWPMPHTDGLLRQWKEDAEMDVAEFFASVARAVRNDPGETKADRTNRDNFAAAARFAYGLNGEQQLPANLAPAEFDKVLGQLSIIAAAVTQTAKVRPE